MKYTIQYRVIELPNGNLDVFSIVTGQKRWANISKAGFVQILTEMVMD